MILHISKCMFMKLDIIYVDLSSKNTAVYVLLIYACISAYVHILCICMYMYVYLITNYRNTYLWAYTDIHTNTNIHIYIRIHTYTYTYMHACIYKCIHVQHIQRYKSVDGTSHYQSTTRFPKEVQDGTGWYDTWRYKQVQEYHVSYIQVCTGMYRYLLVHTCMY
jgi:hypothetical protein